MRVLVIGGVAAGMSAASKLKRLKPKTEVVVFESGVDVSYGACGMPYYLKGEIDRESKLVARTAEKFRKRGVDVRLEHEAIDLDSEARKVEIRDRRNGTTEWWTYDKLLVASGASPIRLDVAGRGDERVLALGDLADMRRMEPWVERASKAVVVGGGYIGVEIAEALRGRGLEVVMLEKQASVLPAFDAEIASTVEAHLIHQGVDVRTGEGLKSYGNDPFIVHSDLGNGYEADFAVEALGVRPNTAFLEGTGIDRLSNGAIRIDASMRTSLEDVYAAGDCASVRHRLTGEDVHLPLGTHANKTGRLAGRILAGEDVTFDGVIGSSVLKAFDLEVARTGLSESAARDAGFDAGSVSIEAPSHAGYYPGAKKVRLKMVYDKQDCRILGVDMVGAAGVAHRINIAATFITAGMDAETVAKLDLAYAPPFSPVWDPLQTAANQIRCP